MSLAKVSATRSRPVTLLSAMQILHDGTLPAGHYGLQDARSRVDAEYSACREIEKTFMRKWRRNKSRPCLFTSLQEMADFSALICRGVGTRPISRVAIDTVRCPGASAFYQSGVVYVRSSQVSVSTIIHETAHHVAAMDRYCDGHGVQFREIEQLLMDFLLTDYVSE